MSKFLIAAGLAASVCASPVQERGWSNNCQVVNAIVNVMNAQKVATPFCSSLLGITTVTQTSSVTSSPPAATVTTSVPTTDVVTSLSTSTVYGTTTVYPVVAVSVTSTCALGATAAPDTPSKEKRGWGSSPPPPPPPPKGPAAPPPPPGGPASPVTTAPQGWEPTPIGTPTCLKGYQGPSITSACSCLSIPTPSTLSLVTVTLPQQTVTKVIPATPVDSTVTSTTTVTSFTSTYSATQYYTSTFTILPQPTATSSFPDGSVFGNYPNLDFPGMDIVNFFCYKDGPAPPSPYPACASYADCVAECVFYNDNKIGGSQTCGTVTYNAPSDGNSGSCYLKTGQVGCGSMNPMTNSSVILPLVPNDVQ